MERDFKKKSFVIYKDWRALVDSLSDADAADLMRAMFAYQDGDKYAFRTPLMESVFVSMIVPTFKNDCDKYNRRCEANIENGKKGGRPKKQPSENETQQNPMGYQETQQNPTQPDKDIDNDKDIDIDIDIDNDVKKVSKANVPFAPTTEELKKAFWSLVRFYNHNCPPKWKGVTSFETSRGKRQRNFTMCYNLCNRNPQTMIAVLKHAIVNLDEDSTEWKEVNGDSEFDNLIRPNFFQRLYDSAKEYWRNN